MTEFCTLHICILKHISKKRGSIDKEGKKERPEGQKKNGFVRGSQKTRWQDPDTQSWRSSSKSAWENHFCSRLTTHLRCFLTHRAQTLQTELDVGSVGWGQAWQSDSLSTPVMSRSSPTCHGQYPLPRRHSTGKQMRCELTQAVQRSLLMKTGEQEFRGAAWQECNGMTGAKGVEHAACIYSWKTEQRKVKRLSCFAYNLKTEGSVKEDRRYQRKDFQKWWQWQCAFCWACPSVCWGHAVLGQCPAAVGSHSTSCAGTGGSKRLQPQLITLLWEGKPLPSHYCERRRWLVQKKGKNKLLGTL